MGLQTQLIDAPQEPADELGASYPALFGELREAFRMRGIPSDEAGDLAQETIVRTLVHLKRHGRTQNDLRPLVLTIARNLYRDRGRRGRANVVPLDEAEEVVDEAPQPHEQVLSSERRRRLQEAVAELSPRHRRVIALWMRGLRPEEIARELGIKRNAADALLHRVRRRLMVKLDGGATLGVFGLVWFRVRSGLRRFADAVGSLDPSASLVQATSGLAAVGLFAVVSITAPAPVDSPEPPQAPAIQVDDATVLQPAGEVAEGEGDVANHVDTAKAPSPPEASNYNVGVLAATGPGESGEVGAGVEYREDDGNTSLTGPVVGVVLESVCRGVTAACVEEPR